MDDLFNILEEFVVEFGAISNQLISTMPGGGNILGDVELAYEQIMKIAKRTMILCEDIIEIIGKDCRLN